MPNQIIHIHAQAPSKPLLGQPCNGCGVCCLVEPCPVGMVLSRRVRGACKALRWDDVRRRYVCGVLMDTANRKPRWLHRWVARMIAAGQGCDAALDAQQPSL
jgi:hypothetical protein